MPFRDRLIPPPSDLWLTPSSVIAGMADVGAPIPTGWAPLDRQLRNGGLHAGSLFLIGGPAFSGKTTIALQIAYQLSERLPVFGLLSDEGRPGAARRIGVMAGVDLKKLEADPVAAAGELDERMGERSILLMKPTVAQACAESVVAFARSHIEAGPCVGLLDSAQTIPLSATEPERQSQREAIMRLMAQIRSWAEELGWIFLVVSQSNRAAYRARRTEENSDPLSSFAEARLENFADVAIALGRRDEETGVVQARFVKNRLLGTTEPFNLRYSHRTGRMDEVDPAETEGNEIAAMAAKLHPAKEKIKKLLRKEGALTTRQVTEAVRGIRTVDILAALDQLMDEKQVDRAKREGKGGGWTYSLIDYGKDPR